MSSNSIIIFSKTGSMLYYFISIANDILYLMMLLSEYFGWYDQIRFIMSLCFTFMVILDIYFLAKHKKRETKGTLGMVTIGLILDLVCILYFSGVWQ